MMPLRISLKDIALRAGVSAMTVSRALRNDPRVLPSTKKRVVDLAQTLGYRPDPQFQKMMGYLRTVRIRPRKESIAFVWPDMNQKTSSSFAHLQQMVRGARVRAEEFGFRLEEFWLKGTGMSSKRLCSIMYNRGIQCLILAPIFERAHGHLSFKWERYSTVTTGLGLWRPQLHRVHFDHYGGMVTLMRKLSHKRCRRIALVLKPELNERMHRAWTAAFLTHHPLGPVEASRLLMLSSKPIAKKISSFLRKQGAESVVTVMDASEWNSLMMEAPPGIFRATLSYSREYPEIPGIDQNDALLGSYAVDFVVSLFNRSERGVPKNPKIMLCQGEWKDGAMTELELP